MPERREPEYIYGWTVDTLHRHIEAMLAASDRLNAQRFQASEEAIRAARDSADRAVTKAEHAIEKKFESQNEFRQTLTDQATTFMPRAEAVAMINSLTEKVTRLENVQATITGATGQSETGFQKGVSLWMLAASLAMAASALGVVLFKH